MSLSLHSLAPERPPQHWWSQLAAWRETGGRHFLQHDRMVIGFAPERITALNLSGRWPPRLVDRHTLPLVNQGNSSWIQGVAALDSLFSDPGWQGRDIRVILSSHYVRHAVIPASPGLMEEERDALAHAVFNDIFGELAGNWEIRTSPATAGAPALACGVSRELMESLRSVCKAAGTLSSVQPSLMPVFNKVCREIGSAAGYLALVEPGRITLASLEFGRWRHVDSRAGDGNVLPQLLLEEAELHDMQPGGILWLCDLTESARLPEQAFWTFQRVSAPVLQGFDDFSSLALWGIH